MPVSLEQMRSEMLPGLLESFAQFREIQAANILNAGAWEEVFGPAAMVETPSVPLSIAIPVVVAAAVVKNPQVTRRGIFGVLDFLPRIRA